VATLKLETQDPFRDGLPPSAKKVGDRIIFRDVLRDTEKNQLAGTRAGFCTCVREAAGAGKALFECQTTYDLTGQGHLTTRGSFLLPLDKDQTGQLAITGGTGAYAKARGQATLTYKGNEVFEIVLEIEV
jgi:hypothetical protein